MNLTRFIELRTNRRTCYSLAYKQTLK